MEEGRTWIGDQGGGGYDMLRKGERREKLVVRSMSC